MTDEVKNVWSVITSVASLMVLIIFVTVILSWLRKDRREHKEWMDRNNPHRDGEDWKNGPSDTDD